MDNKTGRHQSIDLLVAHRVKSRRKVIGLSQKGLGDELGISFQQIQKYECGANRITAGRLYQISEVLKVPINYFFEEAYKRIETGGKAGAELREALAQIDETPTEINPMQELFDSYYSISDLDARNAIFALTKQLGNYFSGREH
ncbi:MAG: helix-turn-helix transcriptional regulator [Pseudomonadota bacterium]|nr:helix-turn-helix transcriptional regulator [Pseudomonadota bacterium]